MSSSIVWGQKMHFHVVIICAPICVNIQERLEEIQMDHREYTLDEDDRKVQVAISANDTIALKKSISFSYPNLPFDKAMQKEHEKLEAELQQSQANMDVGQCKLIERLIDVAENATSCAPQKDIPQKTTQKLEQEDGLFPCHESPRRVDELTKSKSLSFFFNYVPDY